MLWYVRNFRKCNYCTKVEKKKEISPAYQKRKTDFVLFTHLISHVTLGQKKLIKSWRRGRIPNISASFLISSAAFNMATTFKKNDDVYASRIERQDNEETMDNEDKEYIKVVQEALTFARSLKDNPHQFVITSACNNNNMPVVDMSLDDEIIAQSMFDDAAEWGFFQVK